MTAARVLIIGNPQPSHVGAHLAAAAEVLGAQALLLDHRRAWGPISIFNRLSFHFARRRPTRLRLFGEEVLAAAKGFQPSLAIVTGISAPEAGILAALRERGIATANYLTDDPWNPVNDTGFFWEALREYGAVYSPRRANMEDLRRHGCRRVEYLPFAYNPAIHFREDPATPEDRARFACDVAIVGGADADRVPIAAGLARSGLRLRLFGGYWDRWPQMRPFHGGFIHGRDLRMAVTGATVNVCMVRRANRDGHSMRSLEIPAMGGCVVAEDTAEHRELLGESAGLVDYFRSIEEMVDRVRALARDPARARGMARSLERRVTMDHPNRYADRLRRMIVGASLLP